MVKSNPANIICPVLGLHKPVRVLKKVVLPAPFGPISPTRSPCLMVKLMFDSARRPPKLTERLLTLNNGLGSIGAHSLLLLRFTGYPPVERTQHIPR